MYCSGFSKQNPKMLGFLFPPIHSACLCNIACTSSNSIPLQTSEYFQNLFLYNKKSVHRYMIFFNAFNNFICTFWSQDEVNLTQNSRKSIRLTSQKLHQKSILLKFKWMTNTFLNLLRNLLRLHFFFSNIGIRNCVDKNEEKLRFWKMKETTPWHRFFLYSDNNKED